jgi:acyl-CoA thioester hydrolase
LQPAAVYTFRPEHKPTKRVERPLNESREGPIGRSAVARFVPKTTRWRDNDAYGHLNNVVYYELFDSAVNAILIEEGLLDVATTPVIGLVVETSCRYFESLAYPDKIEVGVTVEHIGRSSVRYLVSVFRAGAPTAAAQGHFTHVYVERASNKPTPIPDGHRRLMESLKL